MAVSPNGYWGLAMFDTFVLSAANSSQFSPQSAAMYHQAMSHPCHIGLVPCAHKNWLSSKPKSQRFFGHSNTMPTCKEFFLQKMGLVISDGIIICIQNSKHKTLIPAQFQRKNVLLVPFGAILTLPPPP
jgi:hypothetical protein